MRCVVGGGEVFEHVARLHGSRAAEALREYVPLYCAEPLEVYLMRAELMHAVERILKSGRFPYFAGFYAGRLRSDKPRFIPSHVLLDRLYKHIGHPVRAVKISDAGIRVVLYGRDVLAESVVECFEPVEAGEVVSITGPDGYVYAVGLSKISSCGEIGRLREKDVVAKTIFDLGWYLRSGTVPREARYKV
ncbi:MAG: hypothetical protein N3G79_05635 [Sulfolobales archaeon]|nr:hypothetical protein [Sulfolobales archaeon]